jgi:hypothetical protein
LASSDLLNTIHLGRRLVHDFAADLISLAPGFSQVTLHPILHHNRFNGFSYRRATYRIDLPIRMDSILRCRKFVNEFRVCLLSDAPAFVWLIDGSPHTKNR